MANGSVTNIATAQQAVTATPITHLLQSAGGVPSEEQAKQNWRLAWVNDVRNWLETRGKEYLKETYKDEKEVNRRLELINGALKNMETEIKSAGEGGFKAPDATPLFGITKTPEEILAIISHNPQIKELMVEAEKWYTNYSALLDVLPYYIVEQNGINGANLTPQSLKEDFLVRFRINTLKMLAPAMFAKTSPQNPVPSNVTDAVILMDFVDKTIHEIYRDAMTKTNNNEEIAEIVRERLQSIATDPQQLLEYTAKFYAEYTNIAIEVSNKAENGDASEREMYILSPERNQELVELVRKMITPIVKLSKGKKSISRSGGGKIVPHSAGAVLSMLFRQMGGQEEIQQRVKGKERVSIFFLSSDRDLVLKNISDASQFLGNVFQAIHQFAKFGFDDNSVSSFVREMYNAWFPANANKTRTYGLHSMRMVGVLGENERVIDLGNIVANIPTLLTRDKWETAVSNGWFRVFTNSHYKTETTNDQKRIVGQSGNFRLSRLNGLLVSLGAVVVPDDEGNIVDGAGKKYSVQLIDEIWNNEDAKKEIRSIMNLSGMEKEPKDFNIVQIATKFVNKGQRAMIRNLGKLERSAEDEKLKAEVVSQITKALNTIGMMNRIFIDHDGYLGIDVDALDKEIEEMQNVQKGKRTPAVLTAMQKLREMLVEESDEQKTQTTEEQKPQNIEEQNIEEQKTEEQKTEENKKQKDKTKKYQIEKILDASNNQRRVVLLDEQKVYSKDYIPLLNAIYELSLSNLQSGAVNAVLETFTLAAQNERANIAQIGRGVTAAFGIQEAPDNGEIVLTKTAAQMGEGAVAKTTGDDVDLQTAQGTSKQLLTQSIQSIFTSVTGTKQHAPHQAQACDWTMVRMVSDAKINVSKAM